MKFDLFDAKVFLAAYDSGTFSLAAAQNNVVVAAVSARIKRLEEQFGLKLFERTGHGLRATTAGDLFSKHARRIVAETFDAEQVLASLWGGVQGEIRLITNTDMLAEHLPRALGQFLALHDEVNIIVQEYPASEAVNLVRNGSAHMAIVAEPADRSGLLNIPLAKDHLVLIAPQEKTIATDTTGSVSFGEVFNHKLVATREQTSLTQFLSRIAWEMGRKPQFRFHLDGFEAIARMVEANAGIAIIPASAAVRYASFIDYRIIPIADPRAANMLYLCARNIDQLPTFARALFRHLETYAATMTTAVPHA